MQKLVIDQLFSYGGYYCDQTSWNYWDGCFRNVIWRFYCKNITREAVTFIVDEKRKKAYQETVFTINGEKVLFNLVEYFNAVPFDLIIIAVKGTALEEVIKEIKKCVDKNTIIISVLNGIDSEKVISEYYGREKVIYAVAQGMDAMKFGTSLKYTKEGQLLLGITDFKQKDKLDKLTSFFNQAKINYEVKGDILHSMWAKFMLNVGINQTCMAYNTNYSGALMPGEANDTLIAAMKEIIELSHYEGVDLTETDLKHYIEIIRTLAPLGLPSMAQDAKVRRYSEVEMFAGTVISLASKHKLKVPTNEFLYKRIRGIENSY